MARIALKLEQQLQLSQMQRLMIQMMQLHGQDLRDFLQEQVTNNPLLDIRYPDVQRSSEKPIENNRSAGDSLEEALMKQLRLQKVERPILLAAGLVIQHLDEKGFFVGNLDDLGGNYNLPEAAMGKGLSLVQSFDPPGIAARSLQEAFLLQAQRRNGVPKGTMLVLEHYYNDFIHGRWERLEKLSGLAIEDLQSIRDFLKTLSQQPAVQHEEKETYIRADIEIYFDTDGKASIRSLEELPEVFFRDDLYEEYMADSDKKTRQFIAKAKRGYLDLQTALSYRWQSIFTVVQYIVDWQRDYFLYNKSLKPLSQKDIAAVTGLSPATVSRVCRDRYALFHHQIYPIQSFLAHLYHQDVEKEGIISDNAIMEKMANYIKNEDEQHPWSDQELTDLLLRENIHIARRTVTKFRQKMNVSNSIMRRRLRKINEMQ